MLIIFVRQIMLARLLGIEHFGTYASAMAVVIISSTLPHMGLESAFVHRAPETEDHHEAAGTYFSLRLILLALWIVPMISGALLFASGDDQLALIVLTISTAVILITLVPRTVDIRELRHSRISTVDLVGALAASAIAIYWAQRSNSIWPLLLAHVAEASVGILLFFGISRPWKPRLALDRIRVSYFLRFGTKQFAFHLLTQAYQYVDDLIIRGWLGRVPLGLYSRAYMLASYPSRVFTTSLSWVAGGTYSALKNDKAELSKAFFRTNALLVRVGAISAGLLVVTAPNLISLLVGDQWLPMVTTFRLMSVYMILQPVRGTIANLFPAVGRPKRVIAPTLTGLLLLVAFMLLLVPTAGIEGAAIAVDLSAIAVTILLVRAALQIVTFSPAVLFTAPLIATSVGVAVGLTLEPQTINLSPILTIVAQSALFVAIFVALTLMLERKNVARAFRILRTHGPWSRNRDLQRSDSAESAS